MENNLDILGSNLETKIIYTINNLDMLGFNLETKIVYTVNNLIVSRYFGIIWYLRQLQK